MRPSMGHSAWRSAPIPPSERQQTSPRSVCCIGYFLSCCKHRAHIVIRRRQSQFQAVSGLGSSSALDPLERHLGRWNTALAVGNPTWPFERHLDRWNAILAVWKPPWPFENHLGRLKATMAVSNTLQLYCLCVEKFAFWLVIYIKHSIHLTIKHQLNETLS